MTLPPDMAGIFYPSDPQSCRDLVTLCLDDARPSWTGTAKVVVAPHAGLEYSGPIARTAFRPLEAMRGTIRRVVIIGPAHQFAFRGLLTTTVDAWATPLGTLPVDWTAMQDLLSLPALRVSDGPFGREHSLEVHLPFLQQVLGDFAIVPVLVGNASHADVEEALATVWDGSETLISFSSDLSHFLDYVSARSLDAQTARFIELLQPEKIDTDRACGHRVLGGAL